MTYLWIDHADALEAACATLPDGEPLYLDTEFMRERTYYPHLALVQVNLHGRVLLIDAPRLEGNATLVRLLTRHPLVMHGCSEDIEAVRTWTGQVPQAVQDTQIAAALCGGDLQASYQRLVRDWLGIELPKDATRTDWLQRPLSTRQLEYARDDVAGLPELATALKERLRALERLAWWQEECDRLLRHVQETVPDERAWTQVKGAGHLQGQALARLVALATWRDREARQRDLPRSFLIRDPAMLALCEAAPTRADRLQDLGVHPGVVRRDGAAILAVLEEGGRQAPPAPLPGPLEPAQRDQVRRLRTVAEQVAAELGLEPEVLVRRRWLEALVRQPDRVPEPLQGWRRQVITPSLQEVLST